MNKDQKKVPAPEKPEISEEAKIENKLRRANFAAGLFMIMMSASTTWGYSLENDEKTSPIFIAVTVISTFGFMCAVFNQLNFWEKLQKLKNNQR